MKTIKTVQVVTIFALLLLSACGRRTELPLKELYGDWKISARYVNGPDGQFQSQEAIAEESTCTVHFENSKLTIFTGGVEVKHFTMVVDYSQLSRPGRSLLNDRTSATDPYEGTATAYLNGGGGGSPIRLTFTEKPEEFRIAFPASICGIAEASIKGVTYLNENSGYSLSRLSSSEMDSIARTQKQNIVPIKIPTSGLATDFIKPEMVVVFLPTIKWTDSVSYDVVRESSELARFFLAPKYYVTGQVVYRTATLDKIGGEWIRVTSTEHMKEESISGPAVARVGTKASNAGNYQLSDKYRLYALEDHWQLTSFDVSTGLLAKDLDKSMAFYPAGTLDYIKKIAPK